MLQIRKFSLKFLETSHLQNSCVVFIYRYLNFSQPTATDKGVFYFPNAAGGASTSRTVQRHEEDAFFCTSVESRPAALAQTAEPTLTLHLNSHHNTFAHKQLLFFPYSEKPRYVFHFSFFFCFFSTNSKCRNPPRGKMICSDSPLNQLFPLCGHCFLFFAVKQAKQPVKRPEPLEGTAIVC